MAKNPTRAITQKDFDGICRTCLGFQEVNSIFQALVENIKATDLLEYSIGLQVKENDLMPQNICDNCLTDLYRVYEFKQQCQENENWLKALVQNEIRIKTEDEPSCDDHLDEDNLSKEQNFKIENQITEEQLNSCDVVNDPVKKDNENNTDMLKQVEHVFNKSKNTLKTRIKTEEGYCETRKLPPTSDAPYSCRTCSKSYSTLQEFKIHRMESRHGRYPGVRCEICQKIVWNMKLHMRTHTKEKPHQCDLCFKSFSLNYNLRRHRMSHTGERPYICRFCGKGFIQAISLQEHEKQHKKSPEEQNLQCKYCGLTFKFLIRYQRHVQKHKNGSNQTIKEEKENEHEKRPFLCDVCSATFATNGTLQAHLLRHGEKKFLCSVCGKTFTNKALFASHWLIHTGEKPHSCTICKKSFTQSSSLQTHMLSHTGEKPHKCNYCSKSFRQLPHLKYHIRTHTGQKPYSCPFCEKTFAATGTLQVHIRIHTGEKAYVCTICNKGFYDSTSMKKHRRRHVDGKSVEKAKIEACEQTSN